jgi:hypothetical protein
MRIEGWDKLLADYLAQDVAFEWGKNDCALWVAKWVHIATGQDYFDAWLGKYKTESGAARLMFQRGFKTVADICDAHLLRTPVPLACRGDILLQNGNLGICDGANGFFISDEQKVVLKTLQSSIAWKV